MGNSTGKAQQNAILCQPSREQHTGQQQFDRKKVGWNNGDVSCWKGQKGSRCLSRSSNLHVSQAEEESAVSALFLVGSNEGRQSDISLSHLEQVPAESFGSCCCWMTPDPLVTMSLTRRSEGVKLRWYPSYALLKGRKHLLTSNAEASSI